MENKKLKNRLSFGIDYKLNKLNISFIKFTKKDSEWEIDKSSYDKECFLLYGNDMISRIERSSEWLEKLSKWIENKLKQDFKKEKWELGNTIININIEYFVGIDRTHFNLLNGGWNELMGIIVKEMFKIKNNIWAELNVFPIAPPTWRKQLSLTPNIIILKNGKKKRDYKTPAIKMCEEYGFFPKDDDEADSFLIALFNKEKSVQEKRNEIMEKLKRYYKKYKKYIDFSLEEYNIVLYLVKGKVQILKYEKNNIKSVLYKKAIKIKEDNVYLEFTSQGENYGK